MLLYLASFFCVLRKYKSIIFWVFCYKIKPKQIQEAGCQDDEKIRSEDLVFYLFTSLTLLLKSDRNVWRRHFFKKWVDIYIYIIYWTLK